MIPIEYVSHSRIETFRKNPQLYKKQYVDKIVTRESTPAQALGSLVHAMLLEPDTVDDKFKVAPNVDKRTKAGKEVWEEFYKNLGDDCIAITHDDVDMANRMLSAISDNTASSYYLNGKSAVKEHEILKTIEFDGMELPFKFIPDLYCPESKHLVDIKTVSSYDPLDWGKESVFNGYLRQMALYRYLLRYMQIPINSCVHIVVDKGEYPSCMVVEFDSSDIDRAENQVFMGIRNLLAAHEKNEFKPNYYGIVPKITAPAWAWR